MPTRKCGQWAAALGNAGNVKPRTVGLALELVEASARRSIVSLCGSFEDQVLAFGVVLCVGPEQDLKSLPCGVFDSAFDERGVDSCQGVIAKKRGAFTSLLCPRQAPG